MSWQDVDPELLAHLEATCTPRQLEALRLKHEGYGHRRIARILGISTAAVRDRLDSAARNLKENA